MIHTEYEALDFDGVPPDVAQLYTRSGAYNDYLDSGGPVAVEGNEFDSSHVLVKMDPEAYRDALRAWEDEQTQRLLARAAEVLAIPAFTANAERFDLMAEIVATGRALPFVGAGLSVPCGNQSWGGFLLQLSDDAHLPRADAEASLAVGAFEELADRLATTMGEAWFWEAVERKLLRNVRLRGPVLRLPDLFSKGVITTNFDRVLELAYETAATRFTERTYGNAQDLFIRMLTEGAFTPHLLKLHGDALSAGGRVLTVAQYERAYGNGAVDFDLLLPRMLREAYRRPLIFLGCRLGMDRILQVFRAIVAAAGPDVLPRHHAIVRAPEEDGDFAAALHARELELTQANIFPIWYPHHEHDAVDALVAKLAEDVRRSRARAAPR